MTGMEALENAPSGDAKMGLVYGAFGTGKTETVKKYARDRAFPYVRCQKVDTPRVLLERIVAEYRVVPRKRTAELRDQAVDIMLDTEKWLIIDEVDYLLESGDGAKMVEILRDLHDITDVPVILVGMDQTLQKMKSRNLNHLVDRCRSVVRFDTFDAAAVADLAKEICEIEITPEAIEKITRDARGRIRPIRMWFEAAERFGRRNNLAAIELEHLSKLRVRIDEGN